MLPVRFASVFSMTPTDPPPPDPSRAAPRRRRREVPQLDLWSRDPNAANTDPVDPESRQSVPGANPARDGGLVMGNAARAPDPAHRPSTSWRASSSTTAQGSESAVALTRRQEHLLQHLHARTQSGARAPTLSELCAELGLVSRGSLHKQVSALIEAGLVEPMLGKQRGVRLRRQPETREARAPWLGRLTSEGQLIALNRYEALAVPAWLGAMEEAFVLTLQGDRWRHFGLEDADLLMIAAHASPAESDLVAILIDDAEYLVGRLRHDGDVLVIECDAPPAPIRRVMATRARLQGVVRGLMRRFAHA